MKFYIRRQKLNSTPFHLHLLLLPRAIYKTIKRFYSFRLLFLLLLVRFSSFYGWFLKGKHFDIRWILVLCCPLPTRNPPTSLPWTIRSSSHHTILPIWQSYRSFHSSSTFFSFSFIFFNVIPCEMPTYQIQCWHVEKDCKKNQECCLSSMNFKFLFFTSRVIGL